MGVVGEKVKNLAWSEGIKKTPSIVRSVELLDGYFDGEPSIITSGLRSATDQLAIIFKKMARYGLDNDFPEIKEHLGKLPDFTVHVDELNRDIYYWQRVWSKLLNLQDIVNPPIAAEALFDYYRPGSSRNKKGEVIQLSPHQRGVAFDIGGGGRLIEKSKLVMKAKQDGACFIKNFLVEHVNNCCHVDVEQIGGGTG